MFGMALRACGTLYRQKLLGEQMIIFHRFSWKTYSTLLIHSHFLKIEKKIK